MEYEVRATNLEGLDDFLRAYLEAAEWAGVAVEGGEAFEAFEAYDGARDIRWSGRSIAAARRDCRDFRKANTADLSASGLSDARAGQDFYLSRNGHGAGFFDHGSDDVFDRLQRAAKVYGSTYETFDAKTGCLETT